MVYRIRELGKITRIKIPRRKLIFYGVIFAMAVLVILAVIAFKNNYSGVKDITQVDNRVSLPPPKAKKEIQREFTFPLKDQAGEEVSSIKYAVVDAELQDQIISKGKNYTTVQGRTILVLNLKITNQFDKSIEINTKDYIRLSVNNSRELLAADIHNDPVTIQAQSTKYTRLGFPIYDTDKNLKILVGEIGGNKEEVEINFE